MSTRGLAPRWLLLALALGWPAPSRAQSADPAASLDALRHGAGALLLALEELDRYHPPQATAPATALLAHPEPDVARAAGWYLRREGQAGAGVTAAAGILAAADALPEARRAAALGLGALRDGGAVGPLSAALAGDAEAEVRAAAAEALGELHRAGAAAALQQALAGGEGDPAVRAQAARALGGLPDAEPVAVSAGLSDVDAGVRLETVFALGRLGDRSQSGKLLLSLQSDADCRVRAAAAWALTRAGDCSAAAALRQVRDASTCRVAAQAAGFALAELACD
ncbi:MAG TPA: HEAT repeat domain-containing protein [Myxococcota bacterium]|nr:HEAT repeat domain-containing protein [Myxococcota bacterium]HRY92702.1 HEAT repeat domain-containing protein [Myxococcota bacterium]HSA21528.1 HEAT repeat domain-containing protein [Myxococcota bacterium]